MGGSGGGKVNVAGALFLAVALLAYSCDVGGQSIPPQPPLEPQLGWRLRVYSAKDYLGLKHTFNSQETACEQCRDFAPVLNGGNVLSMDLSLRKQGNYIFTFYDAAGCSGNVKIRGPIPRQGASAHLSQVLAVLKSFKVTCGAATPRSASGNL